MYTCAAFGVIDDDKYYYYYIQSVYLVLANGKDCLKIRVLLLCRVTRAYVESSVDSNIKHNRRLSMGIFEEEKISQNLVLLMLFLIFNLRIQISKVSLMLYIGLN